MWHLILHWLTVHTGSSNTPGTPANYNFWSGFGSDLGEAAILGGVITMYRKHNCHTKGCWRVGKHTVDGTPWCSKHHQAARDAIPQVNVAEQVAKQMEPFHQAIFRRLDDHADLIRAAASVAADGPVKAGAGSNPASQGLNAETAAASEGAAPAGPVDPPAAAAGDPPRIIPMQPHVTGGRTLRRPPKGGEPRMGGDDGT